MENKTAWNCKCCGKGLLTSDRVILDVYTLDRMHSMCEFLERHKKLVDQKKDG